MKKQLAVLTSKLVKTLGSKIIGLLHIGSNEREDNTAFSDIDLILLGKNLEIENLKAVREIVRNINYLVDMSIIQRNQVSTNPDLFQMGTHGCYFLYVLKNAQIIYGVNFFEDYPEPSTFALRTSVFQKISEYTWASRRIFIESNRERSMSQNYQLSSRLMKSIKDVLWLNGTHHVIFLTAAESIALLETSTSNLLSDKEWQVLRSISNPQLRNSFVANMSEDFLQIRVSILEKLYAFAIVLLNGP